MLRVPLFSLRFFLSWVRLWVNRQTKGKCHSGKDQVLRLFPFIGHPSGRLNQLPFFLISVGSGDIVFPVHFLPQLFNEPELFLLVPRSLQMQKRGIPSGGSELHPSIEALPAHVLLHRSGVIFLYALL